MAHEQSKIAQFQIMDMIAVILAEGAVALPVTLSGGALFAS